MPHTTSLQRSFFYLSLSTGALFIILLLFGVIAYVSNNHRIRDNKVLIIQVKNEVGDRCRAIEDLKQTLRRLGYRDPGLTRNECP